MNYYLYYDRASTDYHLECEDWHERFTTATHLFAWLGVHMGPGDTFRWVEDE